MLHQNRCLGNIRGISLSGRRVPIAPLNSLGVIVNASVGYAKDAY